jgi:hypothetical protein
MSRSDCRLRFESFGAVGEVVCDDRLLFESLPGALPPGWRETGDEPVARFELTGDGRITLDGVEFFHNEVGRSEPLLRLGSVIRHHLALHAPAHAFIHAGVVGVGGLAIVAPGSSHSGKTTLVAELVRAGALYYSDEYAVVDSIGMIHPYAKPLSVRVKGKDHLGVPVAVPDTQTAAEPIRAGLIVVTNYEADTKWRPTTLTGGEGALALLAHTVAARPRPRQSLAAASQLSRDALVISGARGESDEIAQLLIDAVSQRLSPACTRREKSSQFSLDKAGSGG